MGHFLRSRKEKNLTQSQFYLFTHQMSSCSSCQALCSVPLRKYTKDTFQKVSFISETIDYLSNLMKSFLNIFYFLAAYDPTQVSQIQDSSWLLCFVFSQVFNNFLNYLCSFFL